MNTCSKECSNSSSVCNDNALSRLLECTIQIMCLSTEDAKYLSLICFKAPDIFLALQTASIVPLSVMDRIGLILMILPIFATVGLSLPPLAK